MRENFAKIVCLLPLIHNDSFPILLATKGEFLLSRLSSYFLENPHFFIVNAFISAIFMATVEQATSLRGEPPDFIFEASRMILRPQILIQDGTTFM